MSCAYWAPKSTTSMVSKSPAAVTVATYLASAAPRGASLTSPWRAEMASLAARRRDPDPGDAAPVQLGDGELVAVQVDVVAFAGQLAERGDHVAGHRLVRPLGRLYPGRLGELVQVEQAVPLEPAEGQLPGLAALGVVLVPDVADELLHQVFQRDGARRAAVLVHDDRQVRPVPPHL